MSEMTTGPAWTAAPPAELVDIVGVVEQRHSPSRPAWTCHADGRPWPCPTARVHLRSRYGDDRVGLSIHMSKQLTAAAVDLTRSGTLPPDLFHRFVGWT